MTERAGSTPDVSIVIVNWNTREHLLRCLDSLQQHPPSRSWETIVVDNASADGSVAAATAVPGVHLIVNKTNRGLPAANNQGFRCGQRLIPARVQSGRASA